MNLKPKQYAQALYEALKDKDEKQIRNIIDNFARVLVNNQDTTKKSKIIEKFNDIWNQENNITEARVITSVNVDKDILEALNSYISQKTQANKVKIENQLNKDMLGGVIIRYEDKIIDASLKSRVKELKNKLIK